MTNDKIREEQDDKFTRYYIALLSNKTTDITTIVNKLNELINSYNKTIKDNRV